MNSRTARCCAGLMCLFMALTEVGYAAPADATPPREYSIEAGPLGDTLAQFAAMSNVQLLFEPNIVAGLRSDGLHGVYTVESGFARILEASGYEIVKREAGVYALVARSGDVKTMRKVRVEAESKTSESATDPVVGYVARSTATATKTDTPLVEIPQAINVVTRDEIVARGGARSINDALAYTPGFFDPNSVNTRNDTRGTVRGFSVNNSLFLDGLRLPYLSDNAAYQVEPSGMERIEILKGPVSTFGQNAPGGLINFVSKRPTRDPLGEIYIAHGTFSRREGSVDVSSSIGDSLLYRVNGMVRRSDTQIDFVEDNRTYVAPSLTWIIGPQTQLTLLGHAQHDTGGQFFNKLPGLGTGSQMDRWPLIPRRRFLGEPELNKYDRRQYAAGYAFEHEFNGALKVAQDFRYLKLDVEGDSMITTQSRTYNPLAIPRDFGFFDENVESYSLDTRAQLEATTGSLFHNIVAGVDFVRSDRLAGGGRYDLGGMWIDAFEPVYGQFRGSYGEVMDPVLVMGTPDEDQAKQRGVYLQDQLKLGRWAVTLGGRYDWAENSDFRGPLDDQAFTAHAGVVYSRGSIAPYVSWSESFEPSLEPGLDSRGRPFKPITGEQIEIGLKLQPDPRMLVTLAVFELKQHNVLNLDVRGSVQTGEHRVRGAEVEAKASFQSWDVSASYAYTDCKVTRSSAIREKGTSLPDCPPHQGALWGVYKLPYVNGLDIGGGARYSEGLYWDPREREAGSPSITLFDLTLGYDLGRHFGAESLRLSLNARNVADEKYVYCDGNVGCSWGARRTYQVAARYAW